MSVSIVFKNVISGGEAGLVGLSTISSELISNHSNKPQTPALGPTMSADTAVQQYIPKPFIDKISIVVNVPALLREELYISLWEAMDNSAILIDAGVGAKGKGFNIAKRIVIEGIVDARKFPLIQYANVGACVERLRLEFVPVDLGTAGMGHLNIALTALMDGGWEFISAFGMITRIDISVDIPNVAMDDFQILPKQGLTTQKWTSNGNLQTYTLGTSAGNQTLIYSRDQKRIAKKQKWNKGPEVRVERRLKNPKIKVKDLVEFPNPFEALKLTTLPFCPTSEQPYIWDMFRDSVKVRGQVAALGLLPEKKRTTYRKYLEKHIHPAWVPDEFWSQWPKMLQDLQFVPAYPPKFPFGTKSQSVYKS